MATDYEIDGCLKRVLVKMHILQEPIRPVSILDEKIEMLVFEMGDTEVKASQMKPSLYRSKKTPTKRFDFIEV